VCREWHFFLFPHISKYLTLKRLFPLLVLISLSLSSFAQEKVKDTTPTLTVKQVYEDAKTGFKDAFTGLKVAAEKLEGPAKHIYGVYVFQHRAKGYSIMAIAIVLLFFGFIILLPNWKKADFDSDDWNRSATLAIVGMVLTLAGIIVTVVFFADDGFTQVINPEYFAIQDVIKAFK
jgi:hypothetical protein